MECGLYFVPEAFGLRTQGIVGRQSAGREFLKAYADAQGERGYSCVADTPDDFLTFRDQIAQLGGDPARAYHIGSNDHDAIARLGVLHWQDPAIGRLAWMRRALGDAAYSICGLTHTLSESGVVHAIQDLLVAPVHEWDAVICTSVAARRAVESIVDDWSVHLKERTGAAMRLRAQLPVIPLGVDLERFACTDSAKRAGISLRKRLGIPATAVVALYFGRFNFLTKSHPTPMFLALEQAAKAAPGADIRLLMVGQFSNPLVEREFRTLAAAHCSNVVIHWIDGTDEAASQASWHAADFFISLSDNMQETFGMTVVEAMAASLPQIVSDWSGLRETVLDGETGFLIRTRMPSRAASSMFRARASSGVERFDDSVAALSQVVDVDISACAARIALLATNPHLREQLAAQSRARAETVYDWKQIMARHQDLWRELAAIRASHDGKHAPLATARPGYVDPFAAFGHFATATFAGDARAWCHGDDPVAQVRAIESSPAHTMLLPMLLALADIRKVVTFINECEQGPSIGEITAAFPRLQPEKLELTLMWLSKFGILHLTEASAMPASPPYRHRRLSQPRAARTPFLT
ncbi:glycosyltransferase family 4 protein [Mesorhizobium sp. CAU 1732]|uniref:glycosyltransferase family 4 protein n=1 Tax=Mesorhizobium sp. CAU 1732 TaxID=3140358 RepID=UPI0032617CAC